MRNLIQLPWNAGFTLLATASKALGWVNERIFVGTGTRHADRAGIRVFALLQGDWIRASLAAARQERHRVAR